MGAVCDRIKGAAEQRAIVEATGSQIAPYGAISRATLLGREAQTLALIEATSKEVVARGEGMALTFMQWASAVLLNSMAGYAFAKLRFRGRDASGAALRMPVTIRTTAAAAVAGSVSEIRCGCGSRTAAASCCRRSWRRS